MMMMIMMILMMMMMMIMIMIMMIMMSLEIRIAELEKQLQDRDSVINSQLLLINEQRGQLSSMNGVKKSEYDEDDFEDDSEC